MTTTMKNPAIEEDANTLSPASVENVEVNVRLTPLWKTVIIGLTITGIVLTMNQVFFWNLFGLSLLTNSFLYLLCACFLPIVLIVQPLRKVKPKRAEGSRPPAEQASASSTAQRPGVPIYDVIVILMLIGISVYFAYFGEQITAQGWTFIAPVTATVFSFVYWVLITEILRRAAGWVIAIIAGAISLYPLMAASMPLDFLTGITYDLHLLAQTHVMGSDSILGMPLQTAGSILVGFLLFGVVLQHTGGADFFHNLSAALFGRYRGGTAKVSITSSAAMGMMSGSAVSNVLTTGPLTIPAMIRSGFSRTTAGAVEATASSGGSITPPIMGTAAFLMVSFVGVPYTEILIAAIIPAVLYFLGIFIQVDGYSALRNLKGTPKTHAVRSVLTSGWAYVIALALLVALLFILGSEAQVPFYVVAFLLAVAILDPRITFGPTEIADMMLDVGKTLGQIIGIIAGVGLILGGLTATGVALSLSRDLVALVGDSVILILIAGAIACFILGMGLTISAAYIFLAIVMAPALIALGVDPMAAHLFVIYWASVSYITPPVGLAAFAAAGISKASPMATSVEAMRLGAVKYIVPFGFALNPALVAQDDLSSVLVAFGAAIIATFALACSFSSWLVFIETRLTLIQRALLAIGGFMMFLPSMQLTLTGGALIAVSACWAAIMKIRKAGSLTAQDPSVIDTTKRMVT